eukprot:1188303-Alexandrium_andersonii.AAC.1
MDVSRVERLGSLIEEQQSRIDSLEQKGVQVALTAHSVQEVAYGGHTKARSAAATAQWAASEAKRSADIEASRQAVLTKWPKA